MGLEPNAMRAIVDTTSVRKNAPNGAARGKNAEDDDKAKARYYEQEVMVKDLYNYDGGSAYRLDGGRILVAFTSP